MGENDMPSCRGKKAKQTLTLETERKLFTYEKIGVVFWDYSPSPEHCVDSGQHQMVQEKEAELCRRHL